MGSTSNIEGCITLGPWGCSQGNEFAYRPEGLIRKIIIRSSYVVGSIQFQADGGNGETESFKFGGTGSYDNTNEISFDNPNEYLMSLNGTFGQGGSGEYRIVKTLCFKTNVQSYGPYGITCLGTPFSIECKSGVIVGFHGFQDKYLHAIGVYVMPESLAFGRIYTNEGKIKHQLRSSMPRMVMPRDAGPWGSGGGNPWDDGLFATIKKVHIHLGNLNMLCALQFEYLKKDGETVLSQIHGGTIGSKVEMVNLDVKDDEYLIGISGYYGAVIYNRLDAIASITFHTNKRIHGPYGQEKGVGHIYYTSTASPGKVVGFHGRDNGFLSAIGVHMKYFRR